MSLTKKLDRKKREECVKQVARKTPKTADWLGQLLDRESVLTNKGNAYAEIYSKRQYELAANPIFLREAIRAKILDVIESQAKSIEDIGRELNLSPTELMFHMVALKRRGLLILFELVDEITPTYLAVLQKTEET
jgi:predicted transcriptional regulator